MWGYAVKLTITDLRICNSKVNMLPYRSDGDRFGTPEWWEAITDEGGDCEDFSIAKYHRLRAMGMRPEQMRFATCFVEPSAAAEKRDRYHCVLLVDLTPETTYVLDNRYPHPMEHSFLPYEWHKLQVPGTQTWEWAQGADKTIS